MRRYLSLILLLACAEFVVAQAKRQPFGVCPRFPLRDEAGNVINPAASPRIDTPYSPRQTCGANGCHDDDKITRGFYFQQGKGEAMPKEFAARYQWAPSPGNYGGNWCSPAPLYRQVAAKKNANARTIDMTSFDFVTATCGNGHPGGGPMEFDREGKRYDLKMSDPASGLTPSGDNGLDGDYFLVVLTSVRGALMALRIPWIDALNRFSYTSFDLGLAALVAMTYFIIAGRIWRLNIVGP